MPKTNSSLEKIGFIKQLPNNANLDDYEVITINDKSSKKILMYRLRKEQINKEDLEDFNRSWTTFQQTLS